MPTLSVTVEGLDKLLAKAKADVLLYPPVRKFFNQAALTVRQDVFIRTPRRTGELQAHLTQEVDHSAMPTWAAVGFMPLKTQDGKFSIPQLVEYGTGIYSEWPGASRKPITPVTASALAFEIGGQKIVRRSVRGMRPARMLRSGWESALPKVLNLVQVAAKEVEAIWRR